MAEALESLETQGRRLNALRVRGFPFADEVYETLRRFGVAPDYRLIRPA